MSAWKQNVVRNFDAAAPAYAHHSDIQKSSAQTLASLSPDVASPKILEIGCGSGHLTRALIEKYPDGQFHITDLSPSMIETAQSAIKHPNLTWSLMDGENPQTEETYDLIIANMAFQWFEDLDDALARLKENLKTKGQILFSVPGPESFKEWRDTLSTLQMPSGLLDFKIPPGIIKEESVSQEYESTYQFLKSLKKLGAHHPVKGYKPLSATTLLKACKILDERESGEITWHVLYGRIEKGQG